jgi:hypothetical protein
MTTTVSEVQQYVQGFVRIVGSSSRVFRAMRIPGTVEMARHRLFMLGELVQFADRRQHRLERHAKGQHQQKSGAQDTFQAGATKTAHFPLG